MRGTIASSSGWCRSHARTCRRSCLPAVARGRSGERPVSSCAETRARWSWACQGPGEGERRSPGGTVRSWAGFGSRAARPSHRRSGTPTRAASTFGLARAVYRWPFESGDARRPCASGWPNAAP